MKSVKVMIVAAAAVLLSVPLCAENATVVSLKGKVEVSREGKWIPLSENAKISEGEVISTGFKSEAVLKYEGSLMQLGPLTRITLEQLAQSDTKDSVSVYLNTGAVSSQVTHSTNKRVSYTVRNPIAVASVRGTDFTFTGSARVSCSSGAVAVTPAGLASHGGNGTPAAGNSTVFTNSEDISGKKEAGTIVVLPGQAAGVDVSGTGFDFTPKSNAANEADSVRNTVRTAADAENVSTDNTGMGNTSQTASGKSPTATVTISVKIGPSVQ